MDNFDWYNSTCRYNPLFLAVHNGEVHKLDSLLKNYSATEVVNGKTLINIAAARGHEEIVRLLTKSDTDFDTLLHIAIKGNRPSVFNLVINKCDVNAKNCHNKTPLQAAAANDQVEFAKILIEKGANVNVQDNKERTPLHYVAANGQLELAKILIEKGVNVNARDNCYRTALYYAFEVSKSVELAEMLFKNGAILTERDCQRWSLLSSAAYGGKVELVKLLMNQKEIREKRKRDALSKF